MTLEIKSDYEIDDKRKNELLDKEWCSDIYAVLDGKKIEFEFISLRRLIQEAEEQIGRHGYYSIGENTFVISDFGYEKIVDTIANIINKDIT
ncbi:MAG TPA: hypothetical protein VMF90_11090 [Rhizobiaceae bacterium]|nr:hypothetical protein [Rhizobiaceae bacterium]